MKTLVTNDTNHSLYIWEDDTPVGQNNENTFVGKPIETANNTTSVECTETIVNINVDNSTIHEDVTPPADWVPNKYKFDGTTWEVDPDYNVDFHEDVPTRRSVDAMGREI